jgi:hypothetical protein
MFGTGFPLISTGEWPVRWAASSNPQTTPWNNELKKSIGHGKTVWTVEKGEEISFRLIDFRGVEWQ